MNWDLLPEGKGRCVGPDGAQIRVWGGRGPLFVIICVCFECVSVH